jgi:hypothetical protein
MDEPLPKENGGETAQVSAKRNAPSYDNININKNNFNFK